MKTILKTLSILICTTFLFYGCEKNKPNQPIKDIRQDSIQTDTPPKTIEASKTTTIMERNRNLIGLWRHTEVLSSGSGDTYMSFATDYFLEFHENGSMLSWVGSSAGSGHSFQSEDRNNADKGEWHTTGNFLILKDPASQQEAKTNFFIDNGRLLLSNENSRKIYEQLK